MGSMTNFAALLIVGVVSNGTAGELGYNLRTVPANPPAGVPFLAAFDDTICEDWMLLGDAEPPVVTVQGSTVRLEVDRITVANCSNEPRTKTLSVPALPIGTYQLELVSRAYQSPGNDLLAQAITFQVGPASLSGIFTVPADEKLALVMLTGLMLTLGYARSRRRA